jgi:hypothetical protein
VFKGFEPQCSQEAFASGGKLLSSDDPYAHTGLLAERYYRVFAASPLIRLVQGVLQENRQAGAGRIIRLVPHHPLPLERFRLLKSETVLAGRGCIYFRAAAALIGLRFVRGGFFMHHGSQSR